MRLSLFRDLLMVAGFVLLLPGPGFAQSYRSTIWGNTLTNNEFKEQQKAIDALLAQEPLAVGASQRWTYQRSGAHGTVRVRSTFHHQAMLCHKVGYETVTAGHRSPRNIQLSWCRTPAGEWKILS